MAKKLGSMTLEELQGELGRMTSDKKALENDIARLTRERDAYQKEVDGLFNKRSAAEKELKDLRAKAQKDVEKVLTEASALKQKALGEEAESRRLRAEAEELKRTADVRSRSVAADAAKVEENKAILDRKARNILDAVEHLRKAIG